MTLPYNNLSSHFRERYGSRITKICIDGGFTCPNRDGTCGFGGCIFCGERGAGEHIAPARSIRDQVTDVLKRAPADRKFIAYFQNFTGTYAPVGILRERYSAALCDPRILALDIGTRPDCVSEEVADLLCEFARKVDVTVELGFQTANDETALRIHRGYPRSVFENAVRILRSRNLPFVVHLMLGLPGETAEDWRKTADYVADFRPDGVKIHSVYVMEDTLLAGMFRAGDYVPPTEEEYIEGVINVLERLPAETVIHRLTGDCPDGLLVAPDWNHDKNFILEEIRARMVTRGLKQGDLLS